MAMDREYPKTKPTLGLMSLNSTNAAITAAGAVSSYNTVTYASGGVINIGTTDNKLSPAKMADWLRLKSINYRRTHDETFEARTSLTGGWFFDCSEFKNWEEGKVKNLECVGMPGAGKTSLASAVIEHLQKGSGRRIVLYIYCKNVYQSMQTLPIIFANLLSQVVEKQSMVSEDVANLHAVYGPSKDVPRLDLTAAALKEEISTFQQTCIVVDALDECTAADHSQIVKRLESLNAQLLITSRWDVPFTPGTYLQVNVNANEADIRTYIQTQLQETRLSKFIKKDPTLSDEITNELSDKSSGMFLIPKLQVDLMQTQRTPQDLRRTLKTLPKDLESTYHLTMQRIRDQPNPADIDTAFNTLKWLRYSKKTLQTVELLHALAFKPEKSGNIENNLPLEEDILAACAGLVVIVEPEKDKPEFRFAHSSIQEFLERNSSTFFSASAEQELADFCLAYLINAMSVVGDDVRHFLVSLPLEDGLYRYGEKYYDYRNKRIFALFPLSEYAGCYWADHAASTDEKVDHNLVSAFFQDPLAPHMYCDLYGYRPYVGPVPQMDLAQYRFLFLASSGLHRMLADYLDTWSPASAVTEDASGWTATYFAATFGHMDTLRVLSDREMVNIDHPSRDVIDDTPLCRAANAGHKDIVLFLLEKGASVNPPFTGRTPLLWAALGGNVEIVQLLLSRGADINKANLADLETPLGAAVRQDHPDVAKLLLENGANPAAGPWNGYPLTWAAFHGSLDIVELLLANGAQPDLPDTEAKTPLFWAVLKQHPEIAAVLLAAGASPNTPAPYSGEPLSKAAFYGDVDSGRLLLDKGARVDELDEAGFTPLCVALDNHHADFARFLLENGANPNGLGDCIGLPLHRAIFHGDLDMVHSLIEHGADPNQTNPSNDSEALLQIALNTTSSDIVRLLVDKGAKSRDKAEEDQVRKILSDEITTDKDHVEEDPEPGIASFPGNSAGGDDSVEAGKNVGQQEEKNIEQEPLTSFAAGHNSPGSMMEQNNDSEVDIGNSFDSRMEGIWSQRLY